MSSRLGSSQSKAQRRLGKHVSVSSNFDREEAWKRKRELHVMDELGNNRDQQSTGDGDGRGRTVARSVSDCGERRWLAGQPSLKKRTRSLTDEDLEELRGCIDLGFGFGCGEDCNLQSTVPALELYYAINRHYRSRSSSPVSPLDGASLYRTSSGESACSPLSDSWRISSPGDHPSQVKTRLRHWAQAVACSIKQGFGL